MLYGDMILLIWVTASLLVTAAWCVATQLWGVKQDNMQALPQPVQATEHVATPHTD